MRNVRRSLSAVAATALCAVAATTPLVATAPQAAASGVMRINGSVGCAADNVQGIWVKAAVGSGWANRWYHDGMIVNYSYTLPRAEPWTVHVGCGGKTHSWKYTPDANTMTSATAVNWFCYTPDDGLYPVKYYCDILSY